MKKSDHPSHQQTRGQQGIPHAVAAPSHEQTSQSGLLQLQRLIGNSAINRLFRSFRGTPAAPPTPQTSRVARKPKGVNMALQGRGRVSQMADDDISLKLTGSVGSGKAKNNPDDVRLVQAKLRQLDYLSADHLASETPAADAKDPIPSKKLPQTILAIRAFQRHTQLTSNTDGRIDPGGLTNKLLDVEDQGVENTAKRAADEITSMFESGGDYGETFLGDSGVVSYGKHQATLMSGTLYKLLDLFVTNYRSKSDYARKLEAYLPRVKRKDEGLEGDSTFIKLLEDAGHSDPHMQAAQDDFFDQHYGGAARKQMANAGVSSALAYAFFYDTQIHGGLSYDLKDTMDVLGGKVGEKGKGGKIITEEAFMKEITKQRQDRNRGFGEAQLKKAADLTKKADELAKAGKTDEAKGLRRKAAQLTKNGNALVRSSSDTKGRLGMWRSWADNEDTDLSGDANGMLMVKGVPIVGLRNGATLRGNGTPPPAPTASGTQAPAPNVPQTSPSDGSTNQAPQNVPATTPDKKDDDAGDFGSISSLDFLSKARRVNMKYAARPPMPGWPYRKELQAIWNSGSYDDFAMKIVKLQIHLLGISADNKEADGILGEKTAKAILKVSNPEFLVDELVDSAGAEIEMEPMDMRSPGTAAPNTANAPTDANTAPPSTTDPSPATQTPGADTTAQMPAVDPSTQMPIAVPTPPVPAKAASAIDSAVQNHPAVARLVTPVKTAFDAYKVAEAAYNAASNAASNAKSADKVAKQAAQETALATMQDERAKARAAMATARAQGAALNSSEFGNSDAMLNQVRALINQRLNENTVYYTQGTNANILHKDGWTAGMRTCNMTVMAMMLEALGKSAADYSGDDLTATAAQYKDQLGVNITSQEELKKLRLPDFMQLVAINMKGSRQAAAASITSHSFITDVARAFGLQLSEIKRGQTQNRNAEANWFLSSKYTQMLSTVGALYQPAKTDAMKALRSDETYKGLRGQEKEAYQQNAINTGTEAKRVQYLDNVTKWIEVDTRLKDQMTVLQTDVNAPDDATQKPRTYEAIKDKVEVTLSTLKSYETELTQQLAETPALKGKLKDVKALIGVLEKAQTRGKAKPTAVPKELRALFDGKGNNDPLSTINSNLKKYESLKKVYETLATPEDIEKLIPLDGYKTDIMTTMTAAIGGGNQVMVNLENHFVRLQSVNDDGIVIDDPGNRAGENNRVSWSDARKYGYFQHYLLVSP